MSGERGGRFLRALFAFCCGVGCGEVGHVLFCEAVVSAGRCEVWGDDSRDYPASDGGDIDPEPGRDLASGDMHRLFVHARSFARYTSGVKHHNEYIWRFVQVLGRCVRRWSMTRQHCLCSVLRFMHDLCNLMFMSIQMQGKFVPRTNSFGARLALIRWQMGWNMKEAALACGFSQQSWRGWELQGHDPRGFASVAERIAERTGVDEYWILTGKAPDDPQPTGGEGPPKPRLVPNQRP